MAQYFQHRLEPKPLGNFAMWALGVLLGCAENEQISRCPEQIDMEHWDHWDHCRTLQEDNAVGDVL